MFVLEYFYVRMLYVSVQKNGTDSSLITTFKFRNSKNSTIQHYN